MAGIWHVYGTFVGMGVDTGMGNACLLTYKKHLVLAAYFYFIALKGGKKQKPTMEDKILKSGAELYAEMSRRGLEIRKVDGRDDGLFQQLRQDLNCPNERLMDFLRESNISAKRFLITFLNIVKPFSQMFAEIWTYLSLHYAPKAAEAVSIRFGFPDSDEVQTIAMA
jgi:hypothetical protein